MSCEMAYRLEQEPASFLRRAAAFLIDVAIVAAIWFATVVAAVIPDNSGEEDLSEPWATIVVVLVLAIPLFWFVYQWISNSIGASIGKKMLSLSVEPADPVLRSAVVRGLVRAIGQVISAIPLGLGYWAAVWDHENRAWHDKLAGTRVIRWHIERGGSARAAGNLTFESESSSSGGGVRYIELRREGVRLMYEHGVRAIPYAGIESATIVPTGDVELRFKGRDMFGRPNEQIVRLTVRDRESFATELDTRVMAVKGASLGNSRAPM